MIYFSILSACIVQHAFSLRAVTVLLPIFFTTFLQRSPSETNSVKLFEFKNENVDNFCAFFALITTVKINPPPSSYVELTTEKTRIGDIVHKLKTFQCDTNTAFIILSSTRKNSTNRQGNNYDCCFNRA